MQIFQRSVIKKHLKNLEQDKVEKAFQIFKQNYNPAKIEQIKTLKEEEYQDGFLREIFVDVLGYTLRPNENYDLQREFKNQTDGKKADAAILKNENAIAVIELKSTKTKDLTQITQQAFNYKNNQPECKYVITSNFQKLRFYIDYSTEFEEFDLFFLDRERFELLYLILHKDSIFSNLPIQLKKETQFHEKEISEELYKDYSNFKSRLYNNLIKNNPDADKLTLFKKSQKLLDRFLFILFAEDSGLLPPNSISRIIHRFEILKDEDAYKPIYDIFRQYFGYMNVGRIGKKDADNIPAYNGGLFYEDSLLDSLKIDDEILIGDLKKLSTYDYNTEIDVNILGHIFEHSLNEIEEITAEIEGAIADQKRTKRKKDGVFYTPKYITAYIVENTIGKLCNDKRKELDIEEIEYDESFLKKDRTLTVKGKKLFQTLTDYKKWLTNLKIIDPACGSGAFLNQALNFLIEEHEKIDDIIADLTNTPLRLFDTDKNILENNLFGVDINEESVEIAQLSLWLRTAKKDRKLSKLNNNIKCGNSLLTSEFNWHTEFPEIMQNGGFDVVIGNPPYVRLESIKEVSESLSKLNYKTFEKRGDLYCLFVEKGIDILKEKGLISFIMPNKWLQASYGKSLRAFVLNYEIRELIDFGDFQIFDGATTYPCIFIIKKDVPKEEIKVSVLKENNKENFYANVFNSREIFKHIDFSEDTWVISSKGDKELLTRLTNQFKTLKEFVNGEAVRGVLTGLSEAFFIDEVTKSEISKTDRNSANYIFPFVQGRNIYRYADAKAENYLIGTFPAFKLKIDDFTGIKNHLMKFGIERLEQSGKKGSRKKTNNKWFETQDSINYYQEFTKPKIMYQVFQVSPCFIYDESGLYCNNSMWILPTNDKGLLAILNSKMGWWLITKYCTQIQNGCQLIWKYFGQIPIPNTTKELAEKADKMLSLHKDLQNSSSKFIKLLASELGVVELSKKLQEWYNLDFTDFAKELQKKKIVLTLSQKSEWIDFFETEKQKLTAIKTEIQTTDKEIDQMVYKLYEIEPIEIATIEKSVN